MGISEGDETGDGYGKKRSPAKNETNMGGIPYIYARVSAYHQKRDGNLARQVDHLTKYVKKRYGRHVKYKVIDEYGSGLNPHRRGLKTLIQAVKEGKCSQVIVMYRDRLMRFGFPLLETIFHDYRGGVRVVDESDDKTGQEQLTEDLMSLIACFSGKMYKGRTLQYTKKERTRFRIDLCINIKLGHYNY